MTCD